MPKKKVCNYWSSGEGDPEYDWQCSRRATFKAGDNGWRCAHHADIEFGHQEMIDYE